MGGEAVANADNVADWEGGQRLINAAVEAFGDLDVLVNNAGILRDRVLVNMTEEEWDAVIHVHLKGHFVPTRWAAAYWREQTKAGKTVKAARRQHVVDVRACSATPARRTTARPRPASPRSRRSARKELSRYGVRVQLHRAGRPHPPHRGHARASARSCKAPDDESRVRHLGPGQHLAARRLPGHRGLPVQRQDLLRAGRAGEPHARLADGRRRRDRPPVVGEGAGRATADAAVTSDPLTLRARRRTVTSSDSDHSGPKPDVAGGPR